VELFVVLQVLTIVFRIDCCVYCWCPHRVLLFSARLVVWRLSNGLLDLQVASDSNLTDLIQMVHLQKQVSFFLFSRDLRDDTARMLVLTLRFSGGY
jgi:hypothetical protein